MVKEKTIVNSWNEWDPLKRVIVGRAHGGMVSAPELAINHSWPDFGYPAETYGPYPREMIDKANEQLDNFTKLLESRGITVDRPTPLNFSKPVSTPDWIQGSMIGCMPPRDVLLTVGNEILEATMSLRARWYEYLTYRPILEKYWLQRHPRPLLRSLSLWRALTLLHRRCLPGRVSRGLLPAASRRFLGDNPWI